LSIQGPASAGGSWGWSNPDVQPQHEPEAPEKRGPSPTILVVLGGLLIGAVYLVLTVVGGGGKSSGPLNPIAQAAEQTASYSGARMTLSASMSVPGAPSGIEMTGSGEFNGADQSARLTATVSGPPPVGGTSIDEIVADGNIYMSSPTFSGGLPDGKSWMEIRDFLDLAGGDQGSSVEQMDPSSQLKTLEAVSDNFTLVGHERVRGAQTSHYSASIDSAKEAALYREQGADKEADLIEKVAQQTGTTQTPVEVWIDGHHLVRRFETTITMPTPAGSASMTMSSDIFDFGISPQIAPPPPEQVYDATDLAKQGLQQLGL